MEVLTRAFVLVFSLAISASALAIADPAPAPLALVMDTTARMQTAMRARSDLKECSPGCLYPLVREIAVPNFDFDRISKLALGKYWKTAKDEQRAAFRSEFTEMLIRTYTSALVDYVNVELRYDPLKLDAGATETTVRAHVPRPNAAPVDMDYVMYEKDGAWKVFDVRIDGISLVSNYRSTFANELAQADLDTLIGRLVDRNRKAETNVPGKGKP